MNSSSRLICSFVAIFLVTAPLFAVTVSINSGNPVYPFPQFQPYVNSSGALVNLGTHSAEGVTHAEMEKTIRDAYQIQMNRAKKPGGGVGGKDYIKYASNPQCSEGDGYGILGPAAMADKETFDGMWLYIHDFTLNKVKRYSDCKDASPGYAYSHLPGWTGAGANSATDGDVDIALALLLAYRQWGEFMGINDACGNPISYKQEAIDLLKGLSDTLSYSNGSLLSGDIGIDGYFKGGDSWPELSGWATLTNAALVGITKRVEQPGPTAQYFDYTAPSYFHEFATFLAEVDSAKYAWNILQFRRAEASSDWLIGEMYKADPKNIPISGNVAVSGTAATFKFTGNMGEDFRLGWRTTLNNMWHGTPTGTWNPSTHMVEWGKTNTYESDMAKRYARFLWDSRQTPWNHACVPSVGTDPFDHWGPMTLITNTGMDGSVPTEAFYFLNWLPAVGSPSAVISQNLDLMAELYRYLEIEWDVETPGDGYLTSVPFYYHGWYRVLGLLLLSGNYHAPADVKGTANTKVYCAIDRSFAFEKDTVTYTLDWRNFGSADALGTVVVDTLHKDFSFVSATNGGVYNNASHTVTWNIGTLPGFKTATGIPPTIGQAKLRVVVASATEKQYRNKASISCTNGTGWTSNDYPNNKTAVMERNHLDIARRALVCDYTANKSLVKPGESVEFSINFENSSDAGWINGGRPGVSFSFSQIDKVQGEGVVGTKNTMRTRLYNDATEAYIDFGNYRISYFLYDTLHQCIGGNPGCTNGWAFTQTITEGINKSDVKLVHEMVVPGVDSIGKWNQRLIIQFSDPEDPNRVENLTTIDRHVSGYRGIAGRIHRGGTSPLRLVWFFNASDWKPVNWGDAWSWDPNISQDDKDDYFPVTNDWADPDRPDVPVNHWNRKACKIATKTVNNILVEEWDGYTWRRVAGNGPMPGREVNNVILLDTIPDGFTFAGFVGAPPLGIAPSITGKVISWSIPKLQIKQGGSIRFIATADGSCPATADRVVVNRAWVSADKESAFADSSTTIISCDTVVKPPTPDHVDIVTDTLTFNSSSDEDLVRVTLDEGTSFVRVYAVVRDKTGRFLRYATGATWTSRSGAATVVATAGLPWEGTVTKGDVGSTFIVVGEPGLKPDSLAVTALPTPPWPAIVSAVMVDDNADIIPDRAVVTVNDTFRVNQHPDSLTIIYRGNRYTILGTALVTGTVFSVPLPLTVTDPQPAGEAVLSLTVDGAAKQAKKNVSDGVGPAITSAFLAESVTGSIDTMNLAFTEAVNTEKLVGEMLQLIKAATGDTTLLTVLSVEGARLGLQARVVLSGTAAARPAVGDYVRFVPGTAGGMVVDRVGNLPHLLNRAVPLNGMPARLQRGWYVDGSGDGRVDTVYLQFQKAVDIRGIVFSLSWDVSERLTNVTGDLFSYGADSSIVKVALPAAFVIGNGIKTSGAMSAMVQFTAFVDEVRSCAVADSAAPVVDHAELVYGEAAGALPAVDTLRVTFSERVVVDQGKTPFLMLRNTAIPGPYTLGLEVVQASGTSITYRIVSSSGGVEYPMAGDSIRINPVSAIGDSGVWQNNPNNRSVALSVKKRSARWHADVVPNPCALSAASPAGSGVSIRIVTEGNSRTPISIKNATISIYDATGNCVLRKRPFVQSATGLRYVWDGVNQRGRIVGVGTYIGRVVVTDGGVFESQQVMIGIVRER